jgi:hypothetical protein
MSDTVEVDPLGSARASSPTRGQRLVDHAAGAEGAWKGALRST